MGVRKIVFAAMLIAALMLWRSAAGSPRDKIGDFSSLSDADLKTVTIQFERFGCYGSCPAYTITIHGDGSVEYIGKKNVKLTGTQKGRIETAKFKELVSKFAQAKFPEIDEDFSEKNCKGRMCTDMSTVVTQLTVKGATHIVKNYYGCGAAPRVLFDLEDAVDKAVNSEQWTGDVSKQGPYGTTCF